MKLIPTTTMWKWRYYLGASLITGSLMIANGVPPMAVLAGILGVAMFMRRRASHLS